MSDCYIGRGLLSVAVLGTGGGFFPLSGESEVSLILEEDNESIMDAREGVNQRVDWYARNYRARLEAQCFRVKSNAIQLLLKASSAAVAAGSASYLLPMEIAVGREYLLTPNLTAVVVKDALVATVDTGDYSYDADYGTIEMLDMTGYTKPFTVTATSTGHTSLPLTSGGEQVYVEALFKGVNKINGDKVMAHFYRLAVDIAEAFKLIGPEFSGLPIRLQACPDPAQEIDSTLGQYGRLILL